MLPLDLLSSAIAIGTNVSVSAAASSLRQIPGLLAPTMQQAAAHAMSTGRLRGNIRTRSKLSVTIRARSSSAADASDKLFR